MAGNNGFRGFGRGPTPHVIVQGKRPDGRSGLVPLNDANNLIVADFLTEVAKGNVADHRLVSKFGFNPDVDVAASETVWEAGGTYTFPAAAGTISVSSSSASDAAAGTGARTLTIEGLNSSYVEITETITLNGVTPVVTSSSFLRVNQALVATAGSTGFNVGTITGLIGGTTVFAMIPNRNATQIGVYTIPDGLSGYLVQMHMTAALIAEMVQGLVFVREFGGVFRVRDDYYVGTNQAGTQMRYSTPIPLPAKSDLYVQAVVSNDIAGVNVRFDVLLVG